MASKTFSFPNSSYNHFSKFIHKVVFVSIFLLTIITNASTQQTQQIPKKPFTKIYAFGDSYTDTGNTISTSGPSGFNYVSKLPYGMTYFHHPSSRYSDGRLMIDFLAQSLSLPFLPPYRGLGARNGGANGVNFAVGGSTAIEHRFFVKNNLTFDNTPESLGTQLVWFNKLLEKQGCGNGPVKCGALLDDALIWVGEIGANDYAYATASSVDKKIVQRLAIKRVSSFLQALLTKGAKYVVIQGLPPIGCLTLAMLVSPVNDRDDIGCVRSQNILSATHNSLLQAEIQGLRNKFPEAVIVYADFYNAYREIMRNQAKYGIKEAFKLCCGAGGGDYNFDIFSVCGSPSSKPCSNPSEYINWDGLHLTEGMYKTVSRLLLQGGYSHPSFQVLLHKKISQG